MNGGHPEVRGARVKQHGEVLRWRADADLPIELDLERQEHQSPQICFETFSLKCVHTDHSKNWQIKKIDTGVYVRHAERQQKGQCRMQNNCRKVTNTELLWEQSRTENDVDLRDRTTVFQCLTSSSSSQILNLEKFFIPGAATSLSVCVSKVYSRCKTAHIISLLCIYIHKRNWSASQPERQEL